VGIRTNADAHNSAFATFRRIVMARDPVCGMEIEENDAAGKSDYDGKTYYFCCPSCKRIFDKEPAKYVKNVLDSTHYSASDSQ
jgi:Cu+-exporting ATPase